MNEEPIDPERALVLAQRRQRFLIALAVIPTLIAIPIILAGEDLRMYLYKVFNFEPFALPLVVAGLVMASGFGLLMLYLQTGFKKISAKEELIFAEQASDARRSKQLSSLSQELSEIRDQFQTVRVFLNRSKASSVLTDEQRQELMATLKDQLLTTRRDELLADIRARVEAAITQDERRTFITSIFKQTSDRLNLELRALGRRGNTNLTIGIITTLSGLVILGELVFRSAFNPKDALDLSAHYIPRITLVIFIEVFAYFFLKLYKASLSEIKYFQNEMTNAEAKHSSLVIALDEENKAARSDILKALAHTERNSILKKGESTVELEKVKLDKDAIAEVLPKLLGAFKAQSK